MVGAGLVALAVVPGAVAEDQTVSATTSDTFSPADVTVTAGEQVTLLGQALRPPGGGPIGRPGRVVVAGQLQEVPAHRVEVVGAVEAPVARERLHHRQAGRGPVDHGERHRIVERDDRARVEPLEHHPGEAIREASN